MVKKKIESKSAKSLADSVAPTIARVEQELLTGLLTQALALKILKNSSKPASELLRELMDIEVEVGRFISKTLTAGVKKKSADCCSGVLSGSLIFASGLNDGFEETKQSNTINGKGSYSKKS